MFGEHKKRKKLTYSDACSFGIPKTESNPDHESGRTNSDQEHAQKTWEKKPFTDVTVVCSDSTTFRVHRYVLSRAPYFETLLLSGFAESKAAKAETPSLFTLPNQFSGKTVELVLHYLYVGSAAFPSTPQPSSLVDVLYLADFLNYEPLLDSCKKLIQFTSPDDTPAAIRALVASSQMKSCEDLKTRAVVHLVRDFEDTALRREFIELSGKHPEAYQHVIRDVAARCKPRVRFQLDE
ncbi:hypothetical protein HK104_002283 [Borealophlyctis nickersoniae]|nr:hypothetical protein HK104_002283 [Borealophlyctis nickersoniae]